MPQLRGNEPILGLNKDHLKERIEDLNQLEGEFSKQERKNEEEIITLKMQLE
jgi:hypothetical protein